jgi:hypothetical protein
MSIKEEIGKFTILLSLPHYESYYYIPKHEAKKEMEYKLKLGLAIEGTKKLFKDLSFPQLEEYVSEYVNLYNRYKEALKYDPLKDKYAFLKDYKALINLLQSNPESFVKSITFGNDIGVNIKLTSKEIISKILLLARKEYDTEVYANFIEDLYDEGAANTEKWTTYNKEFVKGLYPLFNHLRKCNAAPTDTEIREYIGDFAILLGLNYYNKKPNFPVDEETMRKYFEEKR